MGYNINVGVGSIVIKADKVEAALEAINNLFRNGETYSWCLGPRDNIVEGYTSIHEALGDWRFSSGANLDGDVAVLCFTGEKMGDDEIMWNAIAPFITSVHHAPHQNSWVVYVGEDGEKWRYNFIDGKMVEEKSEFVSASVSEELTSERTKRVEAQIEVIELKKQIASLKAMLGPNFKG